MAQVGSLTVDLIAQTASFNANIEKAARTLNSQTAQMNRSLASLQQRLDGFATGAKALRDTFLTYQLGQFIGEQFKYAASLGETSQQLGITTRQLQVYSAIAGQVGIEQADLETSLGKLTTTLGKAALGADAPSKAFAALGISVKTADGHVKTAGDALPEIADKLAKVTDPAQRAAAEVALFGRSGQKLDNILTGGSAGIEQYAKQLEDTGQILDDKLINQADTAADRIEELNRQLKVSVAKVVAENATSILALANALATLSGRALQFISNYPRLTAALAGAAAGARLGGLPGALVGAGAGFAGTTYYQQNSSMDLGTRTAELNKATQQVQRMVARGATGANNRAGLHQQLNELNRQRGLMAQAMKANATPQLPALPPVTQGEDLPSFLSPSGGSHRTPKDKTSQFEHEYADMLARLNDDLLGAKKDNLSDVGQIADINRQQLKVETDNLTADLTALAAKNPIVAAHKAELQALIQQADAQHHLTISTEQLAEESKQQLDVQLAANDNQRDVLQAQGNLADTSKDRTTIALRLLDIDKDEERLRLQNVIDMARLGKATAAEAQAAEMRLGKLDAIYTPRAEAVRRQNEGPLDQYIRANDPKQYNDKVEGLIVTELDEVKNTIGNAITSRLGIKDPLLAGLLDLFIQQNLINPIADAIRNARSSGGGGGGFLGSLLKIGGSLVKGVSANFTPSAGLLKDAGKTIAGNAAIFGDGGFVRGPGSSTSDSIHARLSDGEFVFRAEAVRRLGVANLNAMNRGAAPRFAAGGLVGRGQAFAAGNDNSATYNVHVHPYPGMSGREARETGAQAYRGLRDAQANQRRLGA